jgi:hypothetical protein
MGLTRYHHSLAWGFRHGALRWAPYWVRLTILVVWNHITCRLFGHDIFGPIIEDGHVLHGKVCVNCSKKYTFDIPDPEPSDISYF